ncbi:MAG: 5'-methylthioadenosine/S-adenosylhomocysteine nucleosidase [Actinomycetaceae bacterium]|nr:5'-methylthioadenosine/S-adenosylhomocysteine nucleosidase [Actinomycetaceae bacterium]
MTTTPNAIPSATPSITPGNSPSTIAKAIAADRTTTHLPIILCAMQEEAEPWFDMAESHEQVAAYGKSTWFYLQLKQQDLVLGISGIGLVNAASATTIAITQFLPPAIIYTGTCGGLAASVNVRDIICGNSYIYGTADATAFGYQRGQVPQMPKYYSGDAQLLHRAKSPQSHTLAPHNAEARDNTETPNSQTPHAQRILQGEVVSSDSFVTATNVDQFRKDFPDALSVDMESCAAAQVCYSYGVPFVSIRGVSDLCSPQGAQEFHINTDTAAKAPQQAVLAALSHYL